MVTVTLVSRLQRFWFSLASTCNIGAELDEDVWRHAGWDCCALGGSPQVICSEDDADYERAECRILGYRVCLTRSIVE